MKLFLKNPIEPIFVNQGFGENKNSFYAQWGLKGHNGFDFAADNLQKVFAAHDGIVLYIERDITKGYGVYLKTNDKVDWTDGSNYFKSGYWHLASWSVKEGDFLRSGDLIGYADNTGYSTGTHLHFEIKPLDDNLPPNNLLQDNGYFGAIDPKPYMSTTDWYPKQFKYQFNKNLYFGLKDFDVGMLQEALTLDLGQEIPQTNYFGPITAQAISTFQKKYSIIDLATINRLGGKYCGPKTRFKLNQLYDS